MSNTPANARHGQKSPHIETLISPLSQQNKRMVKPFSGGLQYLQQQSPDLPETEENELKTARQRRHSRNFSSILHLSKISAASVEELSETRSNVKWSKDQLLQHYSQCMKLSQENKINHKNAFDLQLIEHMGEMIRQDGPMNFRVAGGTIFAGAKIYASRVDAIHSEIYRVLSSLGTGEKEDGEIEEDNPQEDGKKKVKKRKKNSKILETNESNLRLNIINCSCPMETADRIRGSTVDAASCDSLSINQTLLGQSEAIILFEPNTLPSESGAFVHAGDDDSANTNDKPSMFHTIVRNSAENFEVPPKSACDVIKDFDYNQTALGGHFADTSDSIENSDELQTSVDAEKTAYDFACAASEDDGDFPDEPDDCNAVDEAVFNNSSDNKENHFVQKKTVEMSDALDLASLIAVAPGEYSYFKPNVLSVFDGPTHWLRHKSVRAASTNATASGDAQPIDTMQSKRRKTAERTMKKNFNIDAPVLDKRLQPQKIAKSKRDTLRANMRDYILLESSDFTDESILRAVEVKVLLRHLTSEMLRKTGVSVSNQGEIPDFNYDNDDYCPATVESDDDYQNDASQHEFPCTNETFFPGFTHSTSSQSIDVNEPIDGGANYSGLLEGDHLISQPRKVEKIQVTFAKRAKRIDVKRLKTAMWTLLNTAKPCKQVPEKDDDQIVEETPITNEDVEENNEQEEKVHPASKEYLFSEVYKSLPSNISQTMADNLSVPLAFTCLLHLANEKQLKIDGMSTLSDLKISQGLD